MIVVLLLILILLVLVFGPFFAAFLALLVATFGSVVAFCIVALLGFVGVIYVALSVGWCVWWIADPKAAMAALRAAEDARAARGR